MIGLKASDPVGKLLSHPVLGPLCPYLLRQRFDPSHFDHEASIGEFSLLCGQPASYFLNALEAVLSLIEKGKKPVIPFSEDTGLIDFGRKHPDKPPFIVMAGGGYRDVSSLSEGYPFVDWLDKAGYDALLLVYSSGSKARYPMPFDDLARAVKLALGGGSSYYLAGCSAGGHLAGAFATEEFGAPHYGLPLPRALFLCFPVVTMGEKTHPGTREKLLGKDPDPALVRGLSIEKNVGPLFPPTYLWNFDGDPVVDPINSRMLDEALSKAHVRHVYHPFNGSHHGGSLGRGGAEGWFNEAVSFLKEIEG